MPAVQTHRATTRRAAPAPARRPRRSATARPIAVERHRPALGEGDLALLGALDDRHGVAVLAVAAAGHVGLDGHRRRRRVGVQRGDPQRVQPRAADHEPGALARVAGVEQLADRPGRGGALERGVVAVDGVRPGGDGPARGGLEHVGREAAVDHREVERGGARGAVEVEVGEAGDLVVRDGVGGGELRDGLVAQARVAPRRGDDLRVEVVGALRVLLDREQHPAAVALAERPVLRDRDDLLLAGAGDRGAGAVLDDVALARLHAHGHAVVGVVGAVDEAEVGDLRLGQQLADVVPALAVEVVQAALPLDHQVRAEHLAQLVAVARGPRADDQLQQRGRLAAHLVGGERGVVVRGLGGGQLDGARPRLAAPARAAHGHRGRDGREEDEGEERADEDQERDAAAGAARAGAARGAAAGEAAAASPAATAASAEAGRAAARTGVHERGEHGDQRPHEDQRGDEQDDA